MRAILAQSAVGFSTDSGPRAQLWWQPGGVASRSWAALTALLILTSTWRDPSRAAAQIAEADAGPDVSADVVESRTTAASVDSKFWPGRLQVYDRVAGKIRPVRRTQLILIRDGEVRGRATTDVGGVAQIKRLPAGSYSVVAIGPDGIGAFGVMIDPALTDAIVPYRFDALLVPPADIQAGQRHLAAIPPAHPDHITLDVESDAWRQPAIDGSSDSVDAAPESAKPLRGEPVVLLGGGRMVGQLLTLDPSSGQQRPLVEAPAVLLRDGKVLMTSTSDRDGLCEFAGLEPGYYSLIASNTDGLAAVGLVVEADASTAEPFTALPNLRATQFVSLLQPQPGFSITGAGPDAAPFIPGFGNPPPPLATVPPPPGGGFGAAGGPGGAAGGGGGGVGGGGGGGLLGALLGAGIGAAIGAAVADDNDSDQAQQAVSPNSPPAGQ